MVTRDPLSKSTHSGIKLLVSTDRNKREMHVVPEESEEADPKSSFQTSIDLQIEEVERSAEEEVSYFDGWVHIRTIQNLSVFKATEVHFLRPSSLRRPYSLLQRLIM